jgi:hypothetical protein
MASKKSQMAKKNQPKWVKPKKEESPFSPEKQEYLDRCKKRADLKKKAESQRRVRKIGVTFVPNDGDAPCAHMVEHVKKVEPNNDLSSAD